MSERPTRARAKWGAYKARRVPEATPVFCVPQSPTAVRVNVRTGSAEPVQGASCSQKWAIAEAGARIAPNLVPGPLSPQDDDRALMKADDGFEKLEDLARVVWGEQANESGACSPVWTDADSARPSPSAKTPFSFSCIGSPMANLPRLQSNQSSGANSPGPHTTCSV